jgi:hypothetical protein
MAQGSLTDPTTVASAVLFVKAADASGAVIRSRQLAVALVRDLLQAAGWLHLCFGPGSSPQLPGSLKVSAQQAWRSCLNNAMKVLLLGLRGPRTLETLETLVEPHRQPHVPGEDNAPAALQPATSRCAQQVVGPSAPPGHVPCHLCWCRACQ